MSPRLSASQKCDYLEAARKKLSAFTPEASYADELDHVVQSYGLGLGAGVTIQAFRQILEALPLADKDEMLNAFVGRRLLVETEQVLHSRATRYRQVQSSMWDNGIGDERDLDDDIRKKAEEEDRYGLGCNGRIASAQDIADSAMDGNDLSWLDGKVRRIMVRSAPPPMLLLTEGIIERSRAAMVPLIVGICPNAVRRTMRQRIHRLRSLALELAADDEEDQCLSR